ncbi:hypothetical protein CYQ88_01605 [Hydrogenovibrio sp. SC-1]|uniref:hypothetical protein n=1 Tax=Hydrogenovibrio sp. SC-1 TaxID=2065820 RepID=UPI000C7DE836|nr:hypothetical protein [Hydrogenovibrio sp. SC-1]PLA75289.1 hypothetical protein CYQ88_01605 [Hydrogenovibrio sp. SC-1]
MTPSAPNSTKKGTSPFFIALFIAVGLTAILMFMPPSPIDLPETALPWKSQYNAQNQLEALGLTINKSTALDAKAYFGNDIEVKIFSQKDESQKSAEIYFGNVTFSNIRGTVALGIAVDPEKLEQIYDRGIKTTVTALGNREVTPQTADANELMNQPIRLITLIPKKQLTERAIKMRFGDPQRIETQSDGLDHWFYPEKGLEILLDHEGPEALQYSPKIQ